MNQAIAKDWYEKKDPLRQRVVGALGKLLWQVPSDNLFGFLHELHIQFTLTCDAKGHHVCRVYKNWKDENGAVVSIFEYTSSGKSAGAAMRNAICLMLVGEQGDYHEFVDSAWPDAKATGL